MIRGKLYRHSDDVYSGLNQQHDEVHRSPSALSHF